jgi:hypothetical protein
VDGGQWIWMSLILIILSLILDLINKYINLELLGSCIGTWNELLGKKKKKKKKQSWRLSAQLRYPLRALVRRLSVGLAPSFVRLIVLSSVRLVGGSIGWGRSLVIGFCPLPLGFTLCRWALPLVVGFCLPSLGSTLRRWALPFVVGLYPPPMGSTLRRWVLPYAVVVVSPSFLPPPPHHVLCPSSFDSTAHLAALRLVVRVYVVCREAWRFVV